MNGEEYFDGQCESFWNNIHNNEDDVMEWALERITPKEALIVIESLVIKYKDHPLVTLLKMNINSLKATISNLEGGKQ